MKRRPMGIITVLLIGSLAVPLAAEAQPPATTHRIGLLLPISSQAPPPPTVKAFLDGLAALGHVEGRNLTIERRFSEGKPESLPDLAAELARDRVDLIVAVSAPAALAAKQATNSIPVVMVYVGDPVGTGLVPSLAKPGGNLTGVSDMATDLSSKRLELLRETVPALARAAVLWNSADPGMVLRFREIQRAAQTLGLGLDSHEVRQAGDLDRVLPAMMGKRPDALVVVAEILTVGQRKRILDFAAVNRLPAMYEFGLFAREGGLIAYGPELLDSFRRGAAYVDRILKGTRPADLPVEQPSTIKLVVNLKTAKALELTIPQSILIRADEVIQ